MEIPSVGEIICNEIRQRIFDGQYASGDRINVDELARKLNISKTPVREALGRLESEGLVSFKPRMGWRVSSLSMEEFVDFLELQCALRYFISDSLGPFLDKIDFGLLHSINKKLPQLVAEHKYHELIHQNDLFHITIFSAHSNRLILRRLEEIDGIIRLQRVRFFEQERIRFPLLADNAFIQHQEIIKALESRDPERISRVSREHHESVLDAFKCMSRELSEKSEKHILG